MTTYNVSNLDNNASVVTVTSTGPQGADAVLQAGDRGDFTIAIAGNGAQTATINTGVVTSDKILNGTILDADINSSADIDGSKLLNDSVGLTKLGSGALPTDITIASANIVGRTIVDADIAIGTLDNRYYTETELNDGQLDNRYFTETELNNGQLDSRYFTETELTDGTALDSRYFTETELTDGTALDGRYFTETELTNGALDSRYYTETELTNGALDGRYYTETEADARFYNVGNAADIISGNTWEASSSKVATTDAIDARIVDLVDDVGGFVPIANETSFPNANPDINNGAGTLVSVPLANNITSNSSGVISISNGTVGNSTVTINGATASTTFTQGFGIIVETTSTLNTYTFHRYVPKATEVTTVAGSISNVNLVAQKIADTTIATVAGKTTEIGRLGTAAAVADMALLGTTDVVADMNLLAVTSVIDDMALLGTTDVVADMALLGDSNVIADMALLADSNVITDMGLLGTTDVVADMALLGTTDVVTDMSLLATTGNITAMDNCSDDITNINTVAGSIANVNTVVTNLTNITNASNYLNNFLSLYLGEASSNPTVDSLGNAVTEGDLYFNTVDKRIRVFNGSVFQNIGEGLIEVAKFATAAFNTLYTASAGSNSIDLGSLAVTGAVFSNEAIAANRVSLGKGSGTFNLGGI